MPSGAGNMSEPVLTGTGARRAGVKGEGDGINVTRDSQENKKGQKLFLYKKYQISS